MSPAPTLPGRSAALIASGSRLRLVWLADSLATWLRPRLGLGHVSA